VQFSDGLTVTKHQSSIFRGKFFCKLMKLFKAPLYLNGSIEKNRQNGLGGTSIIDDLSSEEQILVVILKMIFLFDVFGPFEEEDEAVYLRLNMVDDLVVLERIYLLDLNSRSSHFFDELGEDSRV